MGVLVQGQWQQFGVGGARFVNRNTNVHITEFATLMLHWHTIKRWAVISVRSSSEMHREHAAAATHILSS